MTSNSNFSEIRIQHSILDLYVDFGQKKIIGKVIHQLDYKRKDIYKLTLDIKDLDIHQVFLGDSGYISNYSIESGSNSLGDKLIIPIVADCSSVSIHYSTQVDSEALLWLSKTQTSSGEHPMLFSQSQPILARSWIPLIDDPSLKFTFEAKVTSSLPLCILMGANHKDIVDDNCSIFKMSKPISSYMLSLAIGAFEYKNISDQIGLYAESNDVEKFSKELSIVPKFLQRAQYLFGTYRWGVYDILMMPPGFPWGGMENPCLSFISPTVMDGQGSLLSLIAHELAHSWSGNLVTLESWDDFWLNEGLTVYLERRICRDIYGDDLTDQMEYMAYKELKEFIFKSRDHEQILNRKLQIDEDPAILMNPVPYEKGYHFFKYLEHVIGQDILDRFLNRYFEQLAFKNISTEGFMVFLILFCSENKLSVDVEDVNIWIQGSGLSEDLIAPSKSSFEIVDIEVEKLNDLWNPQRISTANWTIYQWLYMIDHLMIPMPEIQINLMESSFKFSESSNMELQFKWFLFCLKNRSLQIEIPLEKYLIKVGRKRLIYPLYEEMIKTDEGRRLALIIFEKAKKGYHSLSRNAISKLLEV